MLIRNFFKSIIDSHFMSILIYRKRIKKYSSVIVALLLVIHFLLSVTSVYEDSLTWDEKCYAGLGKYLIETNNYKIEGATYHAPFSYYFNSIFLFFLDIPENVMQYDSCWLNGEALVFNSGYSPQLVVFLIRLPFILLSVLLGYYVFRWSREMFGDLAGIVALILYSFSPSILSSSRLALTDFPVAAFIFIAVYYFWRYDNSKKRGDLLFCGLFTGLAFASKITGLFLIPIYIIIALVRYKNKNLKQNFYKLLIILGISFLIIFTLYGFNISTISSSFSEHYKTRAIEEVNEKFGSAPLIKDAILIIFDKIPLPAPNYLAVIGDVAYFSIEGHNVFLLGDLYEAGNKPFYYFFIVILIKTTVPILIMFFVYLLFLLLKNKTRITNKDIYALVPIAFIFLGFLFNQVSVDLRHIISIYPFIFILCSRLANFKINNKKQGLIYMLTGILLIIWHVVSSLMVYPYYIPYFNEFVGPENGYKALSGANIDAGQDLIRLKNFLDSNNIEKINFSVHGGVDPKLYGIDYDSMPTTCFAPVNENYKPFAANCHENFTEDCSVRKGIVAISVTNLQGRFLKNQTCFDWAKSYDPLKKVGYSIFIYNIT